MSYLLKLVKDHPKISAALAAAAAAGASVYAPGSGPVVRDLLTSLFGE